MSVPNCKICEYRQTVLGMETGGLETICLHSDNPMAKYGHARSVYAYGEGMECPDWCPLLEHPVQLTLDEAIAHCIERAQGCNKCADEYQQLAAWLSQLKEILEFSAFIEETR